MFLGTRYDLWLHAMAGYIIMMSVTLHADWIAAAYTVFVIAWLKEYYDEYYTASSWDFQDINFTIFGAYLAFGDLYLSGNL